MYSFNRAASLTNAGNSFVNKASLAFYWADKGIGDIPNLGC
jgi:hypothetical protein